MNLREVRHAVWLGGSCIGSIYQRGDYTRFALSDEYRNDPNRAVLGLIFEQDLLKSHASALRLPPWFSNLLPEGQLRSWVADDRSVSADREMELLAQVGHDLPGAIQVLPADVSPEDRWWEPIDRNDEGLPLSPVDGHPGWRFSLAGVQLKFSMLSQRDRLTMPAFGEGGDWIVKLPDREYPDVPRNEFTMMSLAASVGINVPEIKLVHRDDIDGLPDNVWPGREEWCYAIRRFDRDDERRLIHIEDLAQVCNVYPERKYSGNYESVASLIYRGHDVEALREFARRLALIILINNGDAHLKNWSLIYQNPRIPTLSPVYDLVSTAAYKMPGGREDLGLKFGGSKLFGRVSVSTFKRLQDKLGAFDADLPDVVSETVMHTQQEWSKFAEILSDNQSLMLSISNSIETHSKTLLGNHEH
ncbi:type II toxin-antitoxin system HipA family toxin [Streptosporangium sp. NPDC004631]